MLVCILREKEKGFLDKISLKISRFVHSGTSLSANMPTYVVSLGYGIVSIFQTFLSLESLGQKIRTRVYEILI